MGGSCGGLVWVWLRSELNSGCWMIALRYVPHMNLYRLAALPAAALALALVGAEPALAARQSQNHCRARRL